MSRRTSISPRFAVLCGALTAMASFLAAAPADADIEGHYLESRTCQVYTGPCFANSEVGLTGKDAVLAWSIQKGSHGGVELSGLKVVMALRASKTLGFGGIREAGKMKSVIYVDRKATAAQQLALVDFAKQHTGRAGEEVVRVTPAPIEMSLDIATLSGKLDVGNKLSGGKKSDVRLITRKARPDDCICSNETAYYPPLTEVANFVPGVATVGEFKGRGLGSRWSMPGARNVYMGTFSY
jgi:hypothetical protein